MTCTCRQRAARTISPALPIRQVCSANTLKASLALPVLVEEKKAVDGELRQTLPTVAFFDSAGIYHLRPQVNFKSAIS